MSPVLESSVIVGTKINQEKKVPGTARLSKHVLKARMQILVSRKPMKF